MKTLTTKLEDEEREEFEKRAQARGMSPFALLRELATDYLSGRHPFELRTEDFIFHATDKKGHNTTWRFALPLDMAETVSELVEKRYFPYRTKEDVIRHGLYVVLKALDAARNLGYGEMLRRKAIIHHILAEQLEAADFKDWVREIEEAMTGLGKDEKAQRKLVNKVWQEMLQMPEGHWKTEYQEYLKRGYSHLLTPWNMAERGEEE